MKLYNSNTFKNNRKKISSYTKKRYHINPIFKIELGFILSQKVIILGLLSFDGNN